SDTPGHGTTTRPGSGGYPRRFRLGGRRRRIVESADMSTTPQRAQRAFSGIQPTGEMHLGNYLGAVRRWVAEQHVHDSIFCVVDLHSLTVPQNRDTLAERTLALTQLLVACGLDPDACTLFVQSHVPEH